MVRQTEERVTKGTQPPASAEDRWITSVGIDIGTSTTKMIVSRLKLARTSGALSLPRYGITERLLAYQSPIYETPLRTGDEVDAERIWRILEREYEAAGIRPAELKSGAVIITGETANKKNARQILHLLAERSGDFVVATAGPDLEGLLAGKGAGADDRSRAAREAVANIDVGGGTANAAVFRRGKPAGTVTFHVGGRLIRLDAFGTVEGVSPSLRPWLNACGYRLEPGRKASFDLLQELCLAMSRDMLDCLAGKAAASRESVAALLLGAPLEPMPVLEEWTISGGIGQLMDSPKPSNVEEAAVHGDIGPLLAHSLKEQAGSYPAIRLGRPAQTVRATVIGAGMQTTEISGATVFLDAGLLPIRNLPVMKVDLAPAMLQRSESLEDLLERTMREGASLFGSEASPPFALAISGLQQAGYAEIQRLAEAIAGSYKRSFPGNRVFAAICGEDVAKALGQALERRFGPSPKVICIDQIRVDLGDYVDLGEPISGTMVPVVVKTLAFHRGEEVTDG
ncbi:ethanolamine utilization protein [Cohnella sp. CFH 77786]|uniref:ethanolamine ammonia-lyase reactivating factor EutA n=1 Tax=Cohnella sp. CFH 77786 TaxID=2662265 RepID=UPI001C6094E6|nr:ethanolamine ammonia-lyase reactivating factor EutA [Cohnella sp. CFH 77786]MBW5444463.1 ethanolamine utilization protein [Cohnella sp. CFH 77786]